jgi:predicted metal-binding membrane protein
VALRSARPAAAEPGHARGSARADRWRFLAVGAALFAASVALVVAHRAGMPVMNGMPMGSGAETSMRMPGGSWPGSAIDFLGLWLPMMAAMMLPSLLPMLWRYHQAASQAGGTLPGRSTLLVGLGYFLAWSLAGLAVYPLGAALGSIARPLPELSRAVAPATGAVVLLAGWLQFSRWKTRLLACCRAPLAHGVDLRGGAVAALRHGVRLGRHCIGCCAGATVVLFALGWMDLRVMLAVTAAITAERVVPGGTAARRAVGLMGMVAGAVLLARA